MTFERGTVFFESPDHSVASWPSIKLEAIDQHADTYEWYIHTDQTPTRTGPVYTSGFSLSGLGASEWPVTINARLVVSWAVGADSVAKDTVDKQVTLYERSSMFKASFVDTLAWLHEYHIPPYLGTYKGFLSSDPNREISVVLDTVMWGSWPNRKPQTVRGYVKGIPIECLGYSLIESSTDRLFTTNGFEVLDVGESDNYTCGYPLIHGSYDPYTERIKIRFAYDKKLRPVGPGNFDKVWPHRIKDEFVGYRIQ